ncbi:hypothetical protein ACHAXH_003395, partial [Discostella pseudostelligera]
ESLSDVHHVLSKKLNEADSHKSVSINEAIVSARAREAFHQSSKPFATLNDTLSENSPSHQSILQKESILKEEIEQRALEKARERMQLELQAIQEQLKRKEEERIQQMKQEQERKEREYHREIAFEKWKANAEKERQQEEKERRQHEVNNVNDATMNQHSQHLATHTSASSPHQPNIPPPHPILGPQIAHLRYKRIHLTLASTLASLPVYEKQRVYRHDRAQNMAKDKKKTLWMGIPGVISLMEEEDGRLSILDGQHRVGMMALLEEEQRKLRERGRTDENITSKDGISKSNNNATDDLANLDLNNVLVEVFIPRKLHDDKTGLSDNNTPRQEEQHDDKAAIFTEINKAEPLKLLDLPGVTNKRTRDIIDYAASHFHDTFPAMFSSSPRCRSPHLNLDNFRDALFASEIIQREKIGSGGELVKWITKRNEQLRIRYKSSEQVVEENSGDTAARELEDDGKKGTINETAIKKAQKHDFYLGLESTWLYK